MKDSDLLDSLKARHAEGEFLAAGGKPGGAEDISYFQAVDQFGARRSGMQSGGKLRG